MLRETVIQEIRGVLEVPPTLIAEDFSVHTKVEEKASQVLLEIVYRGDSGPVFVARIPSQKSKPDKDAGYRSDDFRIVATFNPGELSLKETSTFWGLGELTSAIQSWARRLSDDLQARSLHRRLGDQEQLLKDLEERLKEVPDDYATADEVAKMRSWLSELETELRQRIEALELDSKEKAGRIDDLHRTLESLRSRADSTGKRAWIRSVFARLVKIGTDPKVGQLLDNGTKIAGVLEHLTK